MDREWWRHYAGMVIAMVLGMMVLEPVRSAVMPDGRVPAVAAGPEAISLFMATEMSAGMLVWMWIQGHAFRETLSMCAGMYASFVVLFPLLWAGLVSGDTLLVVGHLIMLATMGVLLRRQRSRGAHGSQADELTSTRGQG